MKKSLIILAAALLIPSLSKADGTLTFTTSENLAVGPFVFDIDGSTKLDSNYKGQIYAGPNAGSLTAVGNINQFGLFGGSPNAAANGVILSGETIAVASVADSASGVYQLRAWQGSFASFEAAQSGGGKWGQSDVVTATFGAQNPTPVPGPNVSGFQSFSLVPEPGTITLGILGLGGLIASRRRKNA